MTQERDIDLYSAVRQLKAAGWEQKQLGVFSVWKSPNGTLWANTTIAWKAFNHSSSATPAVDRGEN